MTAPFAALESRVNAFALARLANVEATVSGVSVAGIFDNAYQDSFGIVASPQPSLLVASSSAASAAVGDSVVANSTTYTVAEIQPDGTGMTRLLLK